MPEHVLAALVEAGDEDDRVTPKIPPSAGELFHCDFYDLSLLGSACLKRQGSDPLDEENKYRLCASGECGQGCRVWKALTGTERPKGPVVVPAFNLPSRYCKLCGRKLNISNTLGFCSGPKGKPGCSSRVPDAPGRGPAELKPAPVVTPAPPPEPAVRTCAGLDDEICDRRLSEFNEDGLCPSHRAAKVRAERSSSELVEVATVEVEPSPPAPPAITEEPMSEKICTVEGCGTPLRSNNESGFCRKHKYKARPIGTPEPARAKPPRQHQLPGMPTPIALPPVGDLPTEYVEKVVADFKRRAVDSYRLAKSIGFDPAAAAGTEVAPPNQPQS